MTTLQHLEEYGSEIATAITNLTTHYRNASIGSSPPKSSSGASRPQPAIPETPAEVRLARRQLLSTISRLQVALSEPTDFVRGLAVQNQVLACVQWLGDFQVLAYIPLTGSVPIQDIADLAGVPVSQLCRIVRMTATVGFLHEPQPGCIAHTALSASFVTKLSHLDAVMFLAENVAPAALRMSLATQRYGNSDNPSQAAYTIGLNTSHTFRAAFEQRPKLKRQWPAYLQCAGGIDDEITELLTRLDWHSLGDAYIVDVGPACTKTAQDLAKHFPALRFIVQLREPGGSRNGSRAPTRPGTPGSSSTEPRIDEVPESRHHPITVTTRAIGSQQPVRDAAVYILRLDSHSSDTLLGFDPLLVLSELQAHVALLRENPAAKLFLAARLLPDPGTVDPEVEAAARVRDLSLMELANERDIGIAELLDMVNRLQDNRGRLVVVDKLQSRNSGATLLSVQHQPVTLFPNPGVNGWSGR